MVALTALVIGVLIGVGSLLMLRPDVVRVAAGTVLYTNGAILFVVAAGFDQPREAIAPLAHASVVADPLAQALALTAIVIGFGFTALLLKIVLAVVRSHRAVDLGALVEAERRTEARLEPEEEP